MGKVIELPVNTRLDIPAERVLKQAKKARLTDAVLIGHEPTGEFYFASSHGSEAETLLLLAKAHRELLEMLDDRDPNEPEPEAG